MKYLNKSSQEKKKIQDTNNQNSDKFSNIISQSNLPLVSVLIPLYNHEKFIVDCLNSIIDQNYPNIEIILVDDASQDDGLKIAKNKLSSANIISVVLKNNFNRGICATLNRAVSIASGKYICFIASDDLLARNRIRNHVNILENNNDELLIGCHGPVQIFEGSQSIGLKGNNQNNHDYTLSSVLLKTSQINLQGCTFLKNHLKRFSFDEDLYFEDWDFFIRIFLQNYKIVNDDNISAHYRKNANGASKNIVKMIESRKKIRDKYFEIIASKDKELADSFDFTIRFWNLIGMSYEGNKVAWIIELFKLFTKNPMKFIMKFKDLISAFKNLLIN